MLSLKHKRCGFTKLEQPETLFWLQSKGSFPKPIPYTTQELALVRDHSWEIIQPPFCGEWESKRLWAWAVQDNYLQLASFTAMDPTLMFIEAQLPPASADRLQSRTCSRRYLWRVWPKYFAHTRRSEALLMSFSMCVMSYWVVLSGIHQLWQVIERRHSRAASSYSAVKAWLGHIVKKVRKHIQFKIKRFKGRLFGWRKGALISF